VLPDQAGPDPFLAVAAGKDGNMYLMNEDDLAATRRRRIMFWAPTRGRLLVRRVVLCRSDDGTGRVVSSGGKSVGVWKVHTSPTVGLTEVEASERSPVRRSGILHHDFLERHCQSTHLALTRPQNSRWRRFDCLR